METIVKRTLNVENFIMQGQCLYSLSRRRRSLYYYECGFNLACGNGKCQKMFTLENNAKSD